MARTKDKGVNRDNNNAINEQLINTNISNDCDIKDNTIDNNNGNNEDMECEDSKRSDNCTANETNSSTNNESKFDKNKISVYFIELKTIQSNSRTGRQPTSMQMAFTHMSAYKWNPIWIKEEDVLEKEWNQSNNCLFIIDSFDGNVFEYLSSKSVRMIGPLTVLYCYSSECIDRFKTIPEKPIPIFSQCMRKEFVSISGFDGLRKSDLIMKIERMCGIYYKDFTKKVHILVTDSVRTKKYKVAKNFGTTVLSSEWVDNCWNQYQHKLLYSNESQIIDKYRLKMFNKLVITVSQVDVEERNVVMDIVKNNGGEYSPSLKLNIKNSILLLKEPNGDKFKYAQLRGIPCLDIKWLYDSLDKGFALPEDKYIIASLSPQKAKSQKTETISRENQSQTKPINKVSITKSSQSSDNRMENNLTSSDSDNSCLLKDNSSQGIIKTIDNLIKNRSDEAFLEGCDVFVLGFDRPVYEAIRSALRACGSMVFNEFKKLVTHVIVGSNVSDTEMEQLFEHKSPKFVTIEWLFECLRQSECSDSNKYEIKNPKSKDDNRSQNSSNRSQNKSEDIFNGPLTVVCPEAAKKALDKWNNESKMDAKHNHKSLGDRMNDRIEIEWNDGSEDNIPSQRPYISNQSNDRLSESNDDSFLNGSEKESESKEEVVDVEEEEEDLDEKSEGKGEKSVEKGFLFSGYDEQTKDKLKEIVQQLNGSVIESNYVEDCATHLVIRDPTATEKTLSAIASGIWVLKENYLYESQKKGRFLNEEAFEWGSVGQNQNDLKSVRKRLMNSAVVWRKYLTEQTAQDLNCSEQKRKKLFDGWNVLIISETKFTSPYTQVLRSGNANVVILSTDLDERQLKTFKFAFVDQNAIKDLPKLGIKVVKYMFKKQKLLKIDFISHFILIGPNSDLTQIINKTSIKELNFNDLETTQPLNVKRKRDETEDNTDLSNYKK